MNGNTQVPHQYPSQSHTGLPMNNQPSYAYAYPSSSTTHEYNQNPVEKWGNTHVIGGGGPPAVAVPTITYNPNNPKASLWNGGGERDQHHIPYLQYSPVEKPTNTMNHQMESVLHKLNSWGNKANTTANNIWHNLKTGSSVSGAAWEKVNVTAKAITEGGFESLYKQSFSTFPNEKLNKSFACYLSTPTGPVAGTLYLSNLHIAFCSDTPISFTSPSSGLQSWSYYKVMAPLGKIGTINPVVMRDNSSEKYIQIVTVDGHDFWFMGFVNYEKASRHLTQSICKFVASGIAVPHPHPVVSS